VGEKCCWIQIIRSMTGKKFALCFLLLLLKQYSVAQDTSFFFDGPEERGRYSQGKGFIIGVSGGLGKYYQSDLKEINQNARNGLTFTTEMTDNFPAAFYYGMYMLFRLNNDLSIGPDYQFHTTGSRLAYSDYSGSYTFDQILSSHSLAIRVEVSPGDRNNPQFCISTLLGIGISKWRVSENLVVGEVNESSSARFDAVRPFVYPAAKFRYQITPLICFVPSLGWNFDLFGKYHLHNEKDAKTDQVAGWTGPRADLSIDFTF